MTIDYFYKIEIILSMALWPGLFALPLTFYKSGPYHGVAMKNLLPAALLSVVFLPAPAFAQPDGASARARLVVSAAWLADHVKDPDLVLLHVGNKATYDAGHIPGARLVDYRLTLAAAPAPGDATALTLEMLPAEVLRERLAGLGISDRSRVIVYQSDDFWTPSTRVMLTLDYAGLSNVSWLDGGQKAWTQAGHALTADAPPQKTGTLSPLELRPVVVDADFVKARLNTPGFAIVDSRSPAFYDGTRTGGGGSGGHKTGHIQGAVNVPFDSLTSPDVSLKSADELRAAFTKAGVKPGDTVITYCHIGQQATATLFAARTLGYKVMMYDGSFEDWSRRDLPVDNPKK
jgi:thiosulfate/3-mercaptopyruvate sulfurtransferase